MHVHHYQLPNSHLTTARTANQRGLCQRRHRRSEPDDQQARQVTRGCAATLGVHSGHPDLQVPLPQQLRLCCTTHLCSEASCVCCCCCCCFEQHIATLQVPMHHVHRVQVRHRQTQLLGSGQHPGRVAGAGSPRVHEHTPLQDLL
jgi:hypothetical protein